MSKSHPGAARSAHDAKGPRNRLSPLVWVFAGIVVAIAVVIVLSMRRLPASTAPGNGQPIPTAVFSRLAGLNRRTWNALGTRQAEPPELARPPVAGAPTVLFIGGEYCPYCAATRWALLEALSRFGTFTGVKYMHSAVVTPSGLAEAYPDTPTVSFLGSHYHSAYVHAELREIYTRQYGPLEKLTAAQTRIFYTYDAPPYVPSVQDRLAIPFLLIGGRYLWISAPYLPSVLAGHSWAQIAKAIESGRGPIADAVLENANELTAAICMSDGQRPAAVCGAPSIRLAERHLPQ